MNAVEVQLDANRVVAFDGHVLEVFGGAVRRFHRQLLTVRVSEPDKRGTRQVTLTQAGSDTSVPVDDAQFTAFQPVLAALREAGVAVAGG